MIFWDGEEADTITASYKMDSSGILAMAIKDDRPYVIDFRGVISTFNGSYFEEVGRIDLQQRQLYKFNVISSNDRWIHPNGMIVVDDEILIAINSRPEDSTDTVPPKVPSGIWAYNPKVGVYHKFSMGPQQDSSTLVEYGNVELRQIGALWSLFEDDELDEKDEQSDFLVGYAYREDNSTTRFATGILDTRGERESLVKAAVLVTTEIEAEQIEEQWEKVFTLIRPFVNSTDKIVVKYRVQEYTPVYTDITWVDTTSFTSTDSDWSTIKTNFDTGNVDYEVEGMEGDGAGSLSHITDISESMGTYTVTVDETITGATTNTAKIRVDRWNKIGEFTDADNQEMLQQFNPDIKSTWIQFRVYMLGVDIELEKLVSKSSVNQTY